MFGRRRTAEDRDVAKGTDADLAAEAAEAEADASAQPDSGPWDAAEDYPAMERVDLGCLRVPAMEGLDIQLVFAEQQGAWVTVRHEASEMQLQAFAAPRSGVLWDDVREEITAELAKSGGKVAEREGPFGPELLASVPAEPGNPRAGLRPVRFVGVDGPRWFLRGLFTGPAAENPAAAAPLEELMREVVVVRGDQPVPPRDMLELTLPPEAAQALAEEQARAEQEGKFNTPPTNPFERGPEFTETR